MKIVKMIPFYVLMFFLLFLRVAYIVDNPVGNIVANIASVIFLIFLVVMLLFIIIKRKGGFKIAFSIVKILLYLVLIYLVVKESHIVDVDTKGRISSYIAKIGCLFFVVFPVETIIGSKIKSMENEGE